MRVGRARHQQALQQQSQQLQSEDGRSAPLASSFVTQVFLADGVQLSDPALGSIRLLRLDAHWRARDVVRALSAAPDVATPGSPWDFVVRPALGDGTPNASVPAIERDGAVSGSEGFVFPYMLWVGTVADYEQAIADTPWAVSRADGGAGAAAVDGVPGDDAIISAPLSSVTSTGGPRGRRVSIAPGAARLIPAAQDAGNDSDDGDGAATTSDGLDIDTPSASRRASLPAKSPLVTYEKVSGGSSAADGTPLARGGPSALSPPEDAEMFAGSTTSDARTGSAGPRASSAERARDGAEHDPAAASMTSDGLSLMSPGGVAGASSPLGKPPQTPSGVAARRAKRLKREEERRKREALAAKREAALRAKEAQHAEAEAAAREHARQREAAFEAERAARRMAAARLEEQREHERELALAAKRATHASRESRLAAVRADLESTVSTARDSTPNPYAHVSITSRPPSSAGGGGGNRLNTPGGATSHPNGSWTGASDGGGGGLPPRPDTAASYASLPGGATVGTGTRASSPTLGGASRPPSSFARPGTSGTVGTTTSSLFNPAAGLTPLLADAIGGASRAGPGGLASPVPVQGAIMTAVAGDLEAAGRAAAEGAAVERAREKKAMVAAVEQRYLEHLVARAQGRKDAQRRQERAKGASSSEQAAAAALSQITAEPVRRQPASVA